MTSSRPDPQDPRDRAPSDATSAARMWAAAVVLVALVIGGGAVALVVGQRVARWWPERAEPTVSPPPTASPTFADGGFDASAGDAASRRRETPSLRYEAGPFVRRVGFVASSARLSDAPSARGPPDDEGRAWYVYGAEPRPGPLPPATPAPHPSLAHAEPSSSARPLTVLPRTPASVGVSSSTDGASVVSYLVAFEGYRGHFHLPAIARTELGPVTAAGSDGAAVRFTLTRPSMADGRAPEPGQRFAVAMSVSAVDARGRISPPLRRDLEVIPVGDGDVEVTLSMREPTDLDLYVTEPSGMTLYFERPQSASHGRLDLDANAACRSNLGVDAEHAFWPPHRAPPGLYRVRVGYFQRCAAERGVDYRVTVRACGETMVFAGSFDGSARPERCERPSDASRSWCQEVVAFELPPCFTVR